jgi:predicted Zn-dependent protease
MTRDGTFWIEDGKVQSGLRNFRFNQSVVQMLKDIVEMGRPVRASGRIVRHGRAGDENSELQLHGSDPFLIAE